MAKTEKQYTPPSHVIEAPKALAPLMRAFHVDSEKVAKALIEEAASVIYGRDCIGRSELIAKQELDAIRSLMKGINPRDALETLYAAQIVVSHMLGMRKLSANYKDDQKLGLNLLQFSNEAMQQLERKRSGEMQNITVNYNYNGQGNALMQMIIPANGGANADQRS